MYYEYFRLGGFMMWPLLICSVLFVAVVFERTWTLLVKQKLFRMKAKHNSSSSQVSVFEFFKDVPPAIGLLGTVVGVVQSFGLTNGTITAESAAAGLGVACFTTVAGLTIAICASVAQYFFKWTIKRPE